MFLYQLICTTDANSLIEGFCDQKAFFSLKEFLCIFEVALFVTENLRRVMTILKSVAITIRAEKMQLY